MFKKRVASQFGWEDPDTGFDFALIHVHTALEYTFEWEQEIRRGEVVLSAGVNLNPVIGKKNEEDMDIGIEPVGGRITKTLGRKAGQGQQWLILHDCPVIKGYSGGPLLTRDGKLLGINFAGRSRSPIRWNSRMSHANAVRPDLDWLTRLIEQDQENISQ